MSDINDLYDRVQQVVADHYPKDTEGYSEVDPLEVLAMFAQAAGELIATAPDCAARGAVLHQFFKETAEAAGFGVEDQTPAKNMESVH